MMKKSVLYAFTAAMLTAVSCTNGYTGKCDW